MTNPVFETVKAARADAHREARSCYPWVRSRGTFLCTRDKSGQCSPNVEAECPEWGGSWREVQALINRVMRDYPHVEAIYISGGFDGADTKADLYDDFNYEPWVSSWSVNVWSAEHGVKVEG